MITYGRIRRRTIRTSVLAYRECLVNPQCRCPGCTWRRVLSCRLGAYPGSARPFPYRLFSERVGKHSQATHLFKTSVVTEMILSYAAGTIFSRMEYLRRSPRPHTAVAPLQANKVYAVYAWIWTNGLKNSETASPKRKGKRSIRCHTTINKRLLILRPSKKWPKRPWTPPAS